KRLGFPCIFLGGFEPFQWVAPTPRGKKCFLSPGSPRPFALPRKAVNTLDRPVHFRSDAPENRNKGTTNPYLPQSIVFVA
ncbi:MAG: hypothetical protein WB766_19885, partial [Roseiarcus sp.]